MNPEIIIINASPRKSGNCRNISEDIEKILKKRGILATRFDIYDMNIEYCNACGYCEKTGKCRIKDDMTPMYEMFDKSYGTVVVCPVYFDSVSAKMKTLIDRIQVVYCSKFILKNSIIDRNKKRIGMNIAVGGADSYDTQFGGYDITMDFFFRSINSRSSSNIKMTSSDRIGYLENEDFRKKLLSEAENYAEQIEKLKRGDE